MLIPSQVKTVGAADSIRRYGRLVEFASALGISCFLWVAPGCITKHQRTSLPTRRVPGPTHPDCHPQDMSVLLW